MSDLKLSSLQREEGAGLRKLELLAPAGSYDAMRAAINAGADAVYMGGSRFGARAYAENPDEEGIIKAIEFCHLRGRKVYLTVNTLFKENELYDCLFEFIKPYYEAGLDAVIVQDIGVMSFITQYFPRLPIHVSTQATVTTASGAERLLNRGYNITRVVPARELSLGELKAMRAETKLEMEVFSHGALCYCYSGQCLLSSMAGGRSGNRGRCAQPCRRMYTASLCDASGAYDNEFAAFDDGGSGYGKKGYFLSPKDMCTLPLLHEMIEAGIDSLKLEGRMKSPEYCAGIVSVYREFIDKYYELGPKEYRRRFIENSDYLDLKVDELRELYNRGGFNNGYLERHNGPEMMSMERPNHSGVEVGKVIGVSGRKAELLFSRSVDKGDVLEIRGDNGKAVYEYTVADLYSRGSKAFVITMKDRLAERGLIVYRTKNSKLLADINENYISQDAKTVIDIAFMAKKNEAAKLILSYKRTDPEAEDGISVELIGNIVEKAQNAPMSEDKIIKQLTKLGDTEFEAGAVKLDCDDDIFIPVGELNRLRREAAESLREKILDKDRRACKIENYQIAKGSDEIEINQSQKDSCEIGFNQNEKSSSEIEIYHNEKCSCEKGSYQAEQDTCSYKSGGVKFVTSVMTLKQLEQVLKNKQVNEIYFNSFDLDINNAEKAVALVKEYSEERDITLFFGLPYICRSTIYDKLKAFVEKMRLYGFIARNHESVALLESLGAKFRTDYNLYDMNSKADGEWTPIGTTLPYELTLREISNTAYGGHREDIDFVVYGLTPVMISAQCVYKNVTGNCMKGKKNANNGEVNNTLPDENSITLVDEKGFSFRSLQQCETCTNVIYNSAVTNIMDKKDMINEAGFGRLRTDFTFETPSEVKLVLDNLIRIPDNGAYDMPSEIMGMKYTNGHYFNGVM